MEWNLILRNFVWLWNDIGFLSLIKILKIELQIFVCLPFVSLLRVSDLPCVDESEVRQKLDRFQSTQFHTEAVF